MSTTNPSLQADLAVLPRLTLAQLRERYTAAFGEAPMTGNRTWLVRRLAWRLQMLAEGDLSERAKQRAAELANDADLRTMPPKVRNTPAPEAAPPTQVLPIQNDERLPPPGTILTRAYKGAVVQVQVLAQGFEYLGQVHPSLSAVAKAVTGTHTNGFLFFRMGQYRRDA
jgi:Protein of unknown function (DUF2924)